MLPSAEKMKAALDAIPGAKDEKELLQILNKVDMGISPAEFNFSSDAIQYADILENLVKASASASDFLRWIGYVRKAGEQGMIQTALHNVGLEVPSAIIIVLHREGWRVEGGGLSRPQPAAPAFSLEG